MRQRSFLVFLLLPLCVVHTAQATSRPSFSCKAAHTQVERKICGESYLGDADRWLAGVYKQRVSMVDRDTRRRIVLDQRNWLKERDDCLQRDEPDRPRPLLGDAAECLARDYDARIAELERPMRHFIDLSEDAPSADNICDAIQRLRAQGLARLVNRHALPVEEIDEIDELSRQAKEDHLHRYVEAELWKQSNWDEDELVNSWFGIHVANIALYPGKPKALAIWIAPGELQDEEYLLFESSNDQAKAIRALGKLGGEGRGPEHAVFVRFHGQPYSLEPTEVVGTGRALSVYRIDGTKFSCARPSVRH